MARATLGFLAFVLLAPSAHGTSTTDFSCEEAVAHLAECCSFFDSKKSFSCYEYDSGSGCGSPEPSGEPSATESQCIESLTCDEIHTSGLCGAAQQKKRGGRCL
jgi:hypothetical protein